MRIEVAALHGRFTTPPFEEATVGDAMHPGLVACEPEASLADVAGLMTAHRVHCVALLAGEPREPHGVITGLDLLCAAHAGAGESSANAAGIASDAFIRAHPDDRLGDAVGRMVAAGVDHAIVIRGRTTVGVLSSADVAAIIAGRWPAT